MQTDEMLKMWLGATDEQKNLVVAALLGQAKPEPASMRLLRMGEAAEASNLSRFTLWRMAKEGKIRTVEVRKGSHRIPEAELRRLCGGL